jgi:hypothetical protein
MRGRGTIVTMIPMTGAHLRAATSGTPAGGIARVGGTDGGTGGGTPIYGPFVPGNEPDSWKPPKGQPAANVTSDDPADQARVERALHVLDGTEHGAVVSKALREHHVPIQVLDAKDFQAKYPGAGGVYDPKAKTMYLPRNGLQDPEYTAIVLAHEGTHHMDFYHHLPAGGQLFLDMGLALGDAAMAAVHLHNPMTAWMDGINGRMHETEVNAYTRQAQVAADLGVHEYPFDLGENADGSVASRDVIARRVDHTELYRDDKARRATIGVMGLTLGAGLAGIAAPSLAARIAPKSYLAAHAWPVYAVAGAIGGALLIEDVLHYPRNLGEDPGTPGYR